MEQETLFTSSKWDILKSLGSGKKSPIDLAKETNTSVANISQQLRLLELAGFVKSERISNRDKGQPRILYSLTENYSYLVVSSPGFVDKKFLRLEEHQKSLLKIWFLEDKLTQSFVERFFFAIAKNLESIDFIGIDIADKKNLKAYLISDNVEVKKLKDITVESSYGEKVVNILHIRDVDLKKIKNIFTVYDPKYLLKNDA